MAMNAQHEARAEIIVTERVALCRCWQSASFPYCDGSHNAYNAAEGDCLGPVIVCCQGSGVESEQP